MVSNTFPVLICSLYILSVKMSFLITCSFLIGRFFFIVEFENFLHTVVPSLCWLCPLQITFPQIVPYVFFVIVWALAEQNFLMRKIYSVFFFFCVMLLMSSLSTLCLAMDTSFLLCFFSPQTFLISCFTFNSVVHFEFIFIRGGRFTSRLIFFPLLLSVYGRPIAPMPFIEKAVSFIDLCVYSSAKTAVAVGGLGIGWRESSHFFSVKIV